LLKKILNHLEEGVGAAAMLLMVTIAFVNVLVRFFTVYSFAFTEEITISMFVWITLLGISIAFRRNAHLAVTFFYDLAPARMRKAFFLLANTLSLMFFALLTWLGAMQVKDEMELGVITDSLAIPAWIYSAGIPVFSVLIMIRIIQSTRGILRDQSY